LRDYFYDEHFRGVDWHAIHDQYAPLIQGAQTTAELYLLINLMIGELRSSHAGVVGSGASGQDGYLGITLDPVEYLRSGRLRMPGSSRIARQQQRPMEHFNPAMSSWRSTA